MPTDDLFDKVGAADGLQRECNHASHNSVFGCGNPDCWKFSERAYEMIGARCGMTREEYENLTPEDVAEERKRRFMALDPVDRIASVLHNAHVSQSLRDIAKVASLEEAVVQQHLDHLVSVDAVEAIKEANDMLVRLGR